MKPKIAYTTPDAPIPVSSEMANCTDELMNADVRMNARKCADPIARSMRPPRTQSQYMLNARCHSAIWTKADVTKPQYAPSRIEVAGKYPHFASDSHESSRCSALMPTKITQ